MHTFAQKPKTTQQTASAKPTKPSRVPAHFGQHCEVNSILHLQRTIGNQAVQRILQTHAEKSIAGLTDTASPCFGHNFSRIPIHPRAAGALQTKLTINKPGDQYEQEADHVSEQVMRIKAPDIAHTAPPAIQRLVVGTHGKPATAPIQRLCTECEDEMHSRQRQPTLLGNPADIHTELEADRVAESFLRKQQDYTDPFSIRNTIYSPSPHASSIPPHVDGVLASPGQSLPDPVRNSMESRFGHSFRNVRIFADSRAAESAKSLHAKAYTIGSRIVFGENQYSLHTQEGQRLLAHELTHIVQQEASPPFIQRQDEDAPADETEPEEEPKDTMAGTMVSSIIIDLRSGRVGFVVPAPKGMILGNVSTDLKPGKYTASPDFSKQAWIFEAGQVYAGKRFEVSLEGALPWTLAYPEKLPVYVGLSTERKGGGPSSEADLVRLFDEMNDLPDMEPPPVDLNPDSFDVVHYDPFYRTDGGNLSKWLKVSYPDDTWVDVHLDSITDASATPRLWAAKQQAIEAMDQDFFEFMLQAFPAVFFVITINPMVAGTPPGQRSLRATRRVVAKQGAKSPPVQSPKAPSGGTPSGQAAPAKIRPVNGRVNVGGGLEKGSESATNLNPIKPGSGGPSKGIPNHVNAPFEKISQIFESGSAKTLFSNRLRYVDVNWTQAAKGAAEVMPSGGRVMLNVWTSSAQEAQAVVTAFRNAGFKNVAAFGSGPGTMISAVR